MDGCAERLGLHQGSSGWRGLLCDEPIKINLVLMARITHQRRNNDLILSASFAFVNPRFVR